MKKIKNYIALSVLIFSILLTPVVVKAEVIPIDGDTSTDSSILGTDSPDTPTDTANTAETNQDSAGVPDTGFAPTQNKILASSSVFIGGALLGGLLGFGIIKYRQKK